MLKLVFHRSAPEKHWNETAKGTSKGLIETPLQHRMLWQTSQ